MRNELQEFFGGFEFSFLDKTLVLGIQKWLFMVPKVPFNFTSFSFLTPGEGGGVGGYQFLCQENAPCSPLSARTTLHASIYIFYSLCINFSNVLFCLYLYKNDLICVSMSLIREPCLFLYLSNCIFFMQKMRVDICHSFCIFYLILIYFIYVCEQFVYLSISTLHCLHVQSVH